MGAELGVAHFLPGASTDQPEFADGEEAERGGAAQGHAPQHDVATARGAQGGEFAFVANIEGTGDGRGQGRDPVTGTKGHVAIAAGPFGGGRRGEVDDGVAAAGIADEFSAEASAGLLELGGLGLRRAVRSGGKRAEEDGGGDASVGPMNRCQAFRGGENDRGGRFGFGPEECSKRRQHERGAAPRGDLFGGETAAVGREGESGLGAGRPKIAVEQLRDGKG